MAILGFRSIKLHKPTIIMFTYCLYSNTFTWHGRATNNKLEGSKTHSWPVSRYHPIIFTRKTTNPLISTIDIVVVVVVVVAAAELAIQMCTKGHQTKFTCHVPKTQHLKKKKKLHGLSPRANSTDRATAACRRSDCQLLRIKGATWSAWRIPTAVFSVF
jgi:hypothetical protein